MARIGIATTQLPELTTAGGIAAVTARLAKELQKYGHDVFIFVGRTERPLNDQLKNVYAEQGITLEEIGSTKILVSPWWLNFQYCLLEKIKKFEIEILICQEWQGIASLASGLSMSNIPIITWLHGGGLYDKVGAKQEIKNIYEVFDIYQEQIQVANSSLVISPSKYLLEFYKNYNWEISKSVVLPYHLPVFAFKKTENKSQLPNIVFVSALSKRKGFDKALETVLKLKKAGYAFSFEIYGKYADIPPKLIEGFLKNHKIDYSLNQNISISEIWERISKKNSTLLVTSRLDNSPGVIYEAISSGVRVLVSETQGGSELMVEFPEHISVIDYSNAAKNWDFISTDLDLNKIDHEDFNKKVTDIWHLNIENIIRDYRETSDNRVSNSVVVEKISKNLTVVIITKDRQAFFKAAIKSVLDQSIRPCQIIVIEDVTNKSGSVKNICLETDKEVNTDYYAIEYEDDLELIKYEPHLGQTRAATSRNLALEKVKTEYIAFLDDDNMFFGDHLEKCMETLLKSDSDAVTPFLAQLATTETLNKFMKYSQVAVMAGDHYRELNLFANLAMDSHICISTKVLKEVGGFPVDLAPEDWALGLQILKAKKKIVSTGLATILYRINSDGNQSVLNNSTETALSLAKLGAQYDIPKSSNWLITSLIWQNFSSAITPKMYFQSNLLRLIARGLNLLMKGEFKLLLVGIKKFMGKLNFLQ